MKKIVILLFGMAALLAVATFFYSKKTQPSDNTLTVGIMSGFEPYARINEQGNFEGFDIDVAQELACRLNKKLVIKDLNYAPLIIALQQGKIDLMLSAISITKERQEQMTLVYYHGEPVRAFPLVFWKKIPAGIHSIDDLAQLPHATICTEAGTKKEQFLQQYSFLTVKTMDTINDIVLDLKYGKSIAMMIDPEILPLLKKNNPALVSLNTPIGPEYQSEGFGIGINKKNSALSAQVAIAIEAMRADGTLTTLEQQWIDND